MFPGKDVRTIESREPDRQRIARQTAEFIARGGDIPVYGITVRDKNNQVVTTEFQKHAAKYSAKGAAAARDS